MSLTGLILIGFLFFHLAGNLLLYRGEKAFNLYAYNLHELGPLLYFAETVLLICFIYHIFLSIKLSKLAREARGEESYLKIKRLGQGTLASRYMLVSGSIIFIFLILHLATFKIYDKELVKYADYGAMEDYYKNVTMWFSYSWYSILYIIASLGLGLHLKHAFASAFKTLGIDHYKYTPYFRTFSNIIALILSLGFASFPIYFGFLNNSFS